MPEPLPSTEPLDVAEVAAWDLEADVVVVGFGASGACAALGATERGADVLVLEASGGAGGTSAMSGGLIYLGGGTPVQQECGFEDSADDMFRFLMAACGPGVDEAKVRIYCDESVEHYHWLVGRGVPFKAGFWPEPGLEPPTDDGLVYSGGEDAHPFDQIARPAPRGHKPQKRHAAGGFLMERLAEAVAASGARVAPDTRVQRLVLDGSTVVGLVGRRAGREVAIRARRGTVLCAGGFVHSDEMVARHAPLVASCSMRLGNDFDDGTAIRMAQSIGAAVMRMDAAECAVPMTPPRSLVAGILVNAQGQRFINEDTYYGRVGQEVLFRQGGEAYLDRRRGTLRGHPGRPAGVVGVRDRRGARGRDRSAAGLAHLDVRPVPAPRGGGHRPHVPQVGRVRAAPRTAARRLRPAGGQPGRLLRHVHARRPVHLGRR